MFKLYLKAKLFTSLAYILIISAFICISIYLGIWQLDRAQYKKNLLEKIMRQSTAVQPLSKFIDNNYQQIRFTKVMLTGNPINNKNILLDNQVQNRLAGYRIITPISIPGPPDCIVLLDRGFITRTKSRQELPDITPLDNPISILGIINNPTSGILLQAEHYSNNPSWPLLVQSLDFAQLQKIFGYSLCNFMVQIHDNNFNNNAINIYTKDMHKHTSYAYQWFIFAVLGFFYACYKIRTIFKNGLIKRLQIV